MQRKRQKDISDGIKALWLRKKTQCGHLLLALTLNWFVVKVDA